MALPAAGYESCASWNANGRALASSAYAAGTTQPLPASTCYETEPSRPWARPWAAEAAYESGSEQISDYEPVPRRVQESLSSEEVDSRSSLGSPTDLQV